VQRTSEQRSLFLSPRGQVGIHMFLLQSSPCCVAFAWHCESCWDAHHNGQRDHDFIRLSGPNQPLLEEAV
jgi:hypothetical protein